MATTPRVSDMHLDRTNIIEEVGDILNSDTRSEGGPPEELPETGQSGPADGDRSGDGPDGPDYTHEALDGDTNSKSFENVEDAVRSGEDEHGRSTAAADTGIVAQHAEDLPEFESTPDDNSDPKSKASSKCENGYSSDDTSELSDGEMRRFELRRAEIRRGKARAASPVLSEAPPDPIPEAPFRGEPRENGPGDARDETLLPVAGSSQNPDDPDVVWYIPWEKDPERPLQKLPIRFRDLNGRTYVLPWQKVKTWNRANALIRRIHGHQPRLIDMINDGEYHLLAKDVWANDDDAAISPNLASYPRSTSLDQQPTPGSSRNNVPGPPNNPMVGGRNRIPQTCDAILLPEHWDAVVEPGMYVDMVAWHGGAHPVFGLVPPQLGRGRGGVPPPPPHAAHLTDEEGLPHYGLTASQANGTMALARGAWPPRPRGQGQVASVAPRKVVRTRVRQKR